MEISRTVGFPGNYSGDGPVTTSQQQWLIAVAKNGIEIRRHRSNTPFKVIQINREMLLQRLGVSLSINVGDIVESINSTSLNGITNQGACQLLCDEEMHSINFFNPLQWKQKIRELRRIPQEILNTNQWIIAVAKNGIEIKRLTINAPFKVISLNRERLLQRLGVNLSIQVGDVVESINTTNLNKFNNEEACQFLCDEELHSIVYFNSLQRTQRQRNISDNLNSSSTENSNNINNLPTQSPMSPSITWNYNNLNSSHTENSNLNNFTNQLSISLLLTWDYDNPCQHCGFIYLHTEKRKAACCLISTIANFPKLEPLPERLKDICISYLHVFSKDSVLYNNILALGATGVENGTSGGWEWTPGHHSVKLHGRTYHFFTNTAGQNGLNFFTYDASLDLAKYAGSLNKRSQRVIEHLLLSIFNELKEVNELVRQLQQIGRLANFNASNHNERSVIAQINSTTQDFDVAAFTSNDIRGNRVMTITRKNQTFSTNIQCTDSKLEPISYPLLFPRGEDGWGASIRATIQFPKYLLCRMIMPELDLSVTNQGGKVINVNRFQLMARLGQTYLVDNLSRAIDYRLAWHQQHQQDIFNIGNRHDSNNDNDGNDNENQPFKSFLSQSCHGSRRHLRKLSTNALTIVSEYGRPSLFITLTCNAFWPEIIEMLLPGQTAFDRPDITCRVFREKLTIFLVKLRKGYYFGVEHNINYELRVIEYQQRGLPHAHLVVQLSNMPNFDNKHEMAFWIDSNIFAVLPNINESSTEEVLKYYNLVDKFMTHTCSKGTVNSCLNSEGFCKKHFTENIIRNVTAFSDKGFPQYKRTSDKDLRIIPHNQKILLDWNGHANVEFAGSTYIVLYLYKYLFKGAKKVRMMLTDCDDVNDNDEIKLYLRGRYLCSMDAMWRVLGYQTYPSPTPTVCVIKVKLENDVKKLLNEGKVCDLLIYFKRPLPLKPLLYTEFFKIYKHGSKFPLKYDNNTNLLNVEYFTITISELSRRNNQSTLYYIYKRNNVNSITRLEMLPITSGEIWYLRLILYRVPIDGFIDAKCYENVSYNSYQLAAIARGLVKDHNEAITAFEMVMYTSTPAELRTLFITLTIEGFPTLSIYNNEICLELMVQDFDYNYGESRNRSMAINELLEDFAQRLEDHGKLLSDYGLPLPESTITELDRAKLRYDKQEQAELLDKLNTVTPNTNEQQEIYNYVLHCIDNEIDDILFIQGIGGSGKTTMAKKLLAAARARDLLCVGCASTALAATNYDNFDTAHGLFKFPVIEEEDKETNEPTLCNLISFPERAELLQNTRLIIWDEFPSNHREIFEAVFKSLNKFEGKIVICMGDFRQIAPVVEGGDRHDVVNASIMSSPLWSMFRIMTLTINMRLLQHNMSEAEINEQRSYSELILAIGEGNFKYEYLDALRIDEVTGEQQYSIANLRFFTDENQAIEFLYPNGLEESVDIKHKAILSITNSGVDHWNEIVQKMNPNADHLLLSDDSLNEVDDPHNILKNMLSEDVLNNFNNNSVPPHLLKLKVGDICIVLRNLAKKHGLTNNTRVRILNIQQYCISVQTISEHPRSFRIPRVRFNFRLPFGESYKMTRTQFPLRLAYSITVNKSQGQEYDNALVDMRCSSFAHGHLYVALSRIRYASKIAVIVREDSLMFENPVLCNIVYPELLLRD